MEKALLIGIGNFEKMISKQFLWQCFYRKNCRVMVCRP